MPRNLRLKAILLGVAFSLSSPHAHAATTVASEDDPSARYSAASGPTRVALRRVLHSLEDAGSVDGVGDSGLPFTNGVGNSLLHSQTIRSKYGTIVWRWDDRGTFEETLQRSSFSFSVTRERRSANVVEIRDSAGGGYQLELDDAGDVCGLSTRAGNVLLRRRYDSHRRLLREELGGVLIIDYAFSSEDSPVWTRRRLTFLGRAGRDVTELNSLHRGRHRGPGALFLEGVDDPAPRDEFAEDYAPAPHGLPLARASVGQGLLLASLVDSTYAALDTNGAVRYRRIAVGSSHAGGMAHEFIFTDDAVLILLDSAGATSSRAIRIPTTRMPGSDLAVGPPAPALVGVNCAYVPGGWVEVGNTTTYTPGYWECMFISGGGGGGGGSEPPGGGGGGGVLDPGSTPLEAWPAQMAESARSVALERLSNAGYPACAPLFPIGCSGATVIGGMTFRAGSSAKCSAHADGATKFAYTYLDGWSSENRVVYLCGPFFDGPMVSALIHEALHLAGVGHGPEVSDSEAFQYMVVEACGP